MPMPRSSWPKPPSDWQLCPPPTQSGLRRRPRTPRWMPIWDGLPAAEREFKEAVHQAQQSLARAHPFVAVVELRLAEIELHTANLSEAQALANDARSILEENELGHQPAMARALRIAGLAALRQGNRDLAQRDLEQAARLLGSSTEPSEKLPSDGLPPAALESAALAAAQGELAVVLETYSAADTDYERLEAGRRDVRRSRGSTSAPGRLFGGIGPAPRAARKSVRCRHPTGSRCFDSRTGAAGRKSGHDRRGRRIGQSA